MGGNINEARLSEAGEVTDDDLAVLDSIDLTDGTGDEAASDTEVESGETLAGGESDAAGVDTDGDEEESDSDVDADEEDSKDSAEDEGADSVEADADTDAAEAAEGDGEEVDDPAPEVVEKAAQDYAAIRKNVLNDVASRFVPTVEQANAAIESADQELAAIEKKYSEPDEDGFVPSLTVADQRRIVQLETQRARGMEQLERVKAELTPAVAKAEKEVTIQQNLATFPRLKAVEAGFREAIDRGIQFGSVAEAIEISGALMRAKGQAVAKPKPAAAKPKPGQIEQAALERSIANKKAGMVTAGRGSNGSKSTGKTADSYRGLPDVVASGLRMWDDAIANS